MCIHSDSTDFFRRSSEKVTIIAPHKGTKTSSGVKVIITLKLQLVPARGRRRPMPYNPHRKRALQLIPARGRKQPIVKIDVTFAITTYPRKGTETCKNEPSHNTHLLQLIPARGRQKLFELFHGHINYNLSPQGDNKAPPSLAFTSSGGALFYPYSIYGLQGRCRACGNGRCNRQRFDTLRNIWPHGTNLLQVVRHILQELLNVSNVQRENAVALQAKEVSFAWLT